MAKVPATPRTKKPRKRQAARGIWQRSFVAALARTGNMSAAAVAAKVDTSTVRDHQRSDGRFADAVRHAKLQAAAILEAEARRRAVDGLVRYKFHAGEAIIDPKTKKPYCELEYSDALLIFLLKAANPRKYRERHQVEHRHKGKILHAVETLSDADLERIAKGGMDAHDKPA
jgi:hypothetical protein